MGSSNLDHKNLKHRYEIPNPRIQKLLQKQTQNEISSWLNTYSRATASFLGYCTETFGRSKVVDKGQIAVIVRRLQR